MNELVPQLFMKLLFSINRNHYNKYLFATIFFRFLRKLHALLPFNYLICKIFKATSIRSLSMETHSLLKYHEVTIWHVEYQKTCREPLNFHKTKILKWDSNKSYVLTESAHTSNKIFMAKCLEKGWAFT